MAIDYKISHFIQVSKADVKNELNFTICITKFIIADK